MRFEDLDAEVVRRLGTPERVAQAQELVKNNQVRYRYRLPDRLQAAILDDRLYQVEVSLDDDRLKFTSPFPWEEESWPPQALAVLWAWISDPDSFVQRSALRERLKKYSKNELVKLLLELADRVLEAREILKQENPEMEEILENIDQIMAEAGPQGAPSIAETEDKLRQAQVRADRLSQSGHLAEARAVYFYLLDNILKLEEDQGRTELFSPELKQELFEEYCQLIHEDMHLDRQLVQQEIEQLESRFPIAPSYFDFTEIKRVVSEKS